jgi:hypothetical protein
MFAGVVRTMNLSIEAFELAKAQATRHALLHTPMAFRPVVVRKTDPSAARCVPRLVGRYDRNQSVETLLVAGDIFDTATVGNVSNKPITISSPKSALRDALMW